MCEARLIPLLISYKLIITEIRQEIWCGRVYENNMQIENNEEQTHSTPLPTQFSSAFVSVTIIVVSVTARVQLAK
jgi:hypothetical protein